MPTSEQLPLALVWMRQVSTGAGFSHALVSRAPVDNRCMRSSRGIVTFAPLFVDGVAHDCTGAGSAFAERLCAAERVEVDTSLLGIDDVAAMILDLVNAGSVAFEADD